jgi:hypothetical protein
VRAEWEHWHSSEHMPERLAIPGFLRGTRWVARSGEPSYFVLYEVAELATITTGAYLERLNNPTPWSRKMMPHHRNMVRSLCAVRAGWGGGVPQVLATIRFAPTAVLPKLPRGQGPDRRAFARVPADARAQTAEQKIRGGDASADWVMLVGGYHAELIGADAAARGRGRLLSPGLLAERGRNRVSKLLVGLIGAGIQRSLSPALAGGGSAPARAAAALPADRYRRHRRRGAAGADARGPHHEVRGTEHHLSVQAGGDPAARRVVGRARAIGAVNTVVRQGDRLVGYNTDASGWAWGFQRALPKADLSRVVLLGAGGAGAAVGYAAWALASPSC